MEIDLEFGKYRTRRIITEESSNEIFTAINCFESNVYLGTNKGNLLHYHRFEDSPTFMQISSQHIRNDPILKILVISKVKRVIVLCGGSMNLFSIPELSPMQSGKLKEVVNISILNDSDLIVLMNKKLKIIRFINDEIRSIGEINDISPVDCVAHRLNKSITIANGRDYEIIDLATRSRTPLFSYSYDDTTNVEPHIVAFSPDKDNEEILLTIKSDDTTSIGMFITSTGEPTRGTLTWISQGYPSSISICWPYVFSTFGENLIVSSLIDLDIKFKREISGKFKYLELPVLMDNDLYSIDGICKKSISSSTVIIKDFEIDVLFKVDDVENLFEQLKLFIECDTKIKKEDVIKEENEVELEVNNKTVEEESLNKPVSDDNEINDTEDQFETETENELTKGPCKEVDSPEQIIPKHEDSKTNNPNAIIDAALLTKSGDLLYQQLLYLYHIYTKDYEKCQDEFDLLLYLRGSEVSLFNGTKQIADLIKPSLDSDFENFFNKQVRQQYLNTHKLNLQKLAYSNLNNDNEFLELVNQDKNSWKIKTPNLINIINSLEANNLYFSMLYSYTLLKDDEKICELATKFLSGEIGPANEELFNLVDLILNSLDKVNDDKIYRNALLEILRVDSSKGISYMKRNVKNHKDEHNSIMKEMINLADNKDFASLKLEILENSYIEGNGELNEILSHLIEMIKTPNEMEVNNFMVLCETFKIENKFNGFKEIINFADYLQINMDATECKEFIEMFLKIYELLNYLGNDKLIELKGNTTFEYLEKCFNHENRILNVLKMGDYYTAEFIAIYGKPPYPKHKYYISETFDRSVDIKDNLLIVFNFYKSNNNFDAIKHFVKKYHSIYSSEELINMLPSDMSVSFMQDYFIDLFIRLDTTQKKLIMRKIFNRQESKITKDIYTDFK